MPLYDFWPVELKTSPNNILEGGYRVYARSDEAARAILDAYFRSDPELWHDDAPEASPWINPEKTKCRIVESPGASEREGLIQQYKGHLMSEDFTVPGTPLASGMDDESQWRTVSEFVFSYRQSEEEDEETGQSRIYSVPVTGEVNAPAPSTTRAALPRSPVTQRTVAHAIRNRVALQFQASALLDFLSELVTLDKVPADRRNVPPLAEALGISEALAEGDLLTVLKELRDELGRFNDALETQNVSTGSLERLRESGFKALDRFSQTVAFGAGGLFIVTVASLLDQAGLIPLSRMIDVFKVLRPGG